MFYPGLVDDYIQAHTAELRREADHSRLVDEAVGRGRPVRMRVAERLHAIAAWIEGAPTFGPALRTR